MSDWEKRAEKQALKAHEMFESEIVMKWEFIACWKQGFAAGMLDKENEWMQAHPEYYPMSDVNKLLEALESFYIKSDNTMGLLNDSLKSGRVALKDFYAKFPKVER